MPNNITFIKVPIQVCDTQKDYHLFDILLPSNCEEKVILTILNLLCKMRSIFLNQKNVDGILSSFLDSQPYIIFNCILIKDVENEEERMSNDGGLKKIKFGAKVYSLNNQENSDFYFHSMICMTIMNYYK